LLPRAEGFCVHSQRPHQPSQRAANRFIIIYDSDQGLGFCQGIGLSAVVVSINKIHRVIVLKTNSSDGRKACILDFSPMAVEKGERFRVSGVRFQTEWASQNREVRY
jgi:hypothetical protein